MSTHIPELVEPSTVVIERLDRSTTVYDLRAREPVKGVSRLPAVTLQAQVSWGRSAKFAYRGQGQGGLVAQASGYLVFRTADLDEAGVVLGQGDKVVTIAGRQGDVYLSEKIYAGHHYGEPQLEIWDFDDQAPKRPR